MYIDEIKTLIKELKFLQKERYNINICKIDGDTLESSATMYLKTVSSHFKQTDEKIEKIEKKLMQYSPLFNATIGQLITAITEQFKKEYPDLKIKPACEVYGYYSECENNIPITVRTARLISKNKFRGNLYILIEIEHLNKPINLGCFDTIYGYDDKPVKYDEKIRRNDLHYDIKRYENRTVNMYKFLIEDGYHPYYHLIQKACYKLIEYNLNTYSQFTPTEELNI